jgi:hypothetical protein
LNDSGIAGEYPGSGSMIKKIGGAAGVAAVFVCATAYADCIEGMRNVTANETQYQKRITAALKDALPAPPPGWKAAPVRESDVSSVCKGDREGDFEVRVSASYTFTPSKEDGDRLYADSRKLQAQIDALKQLPPDVAKERQGWLDKMSEANRASNQAAKAGNKELARQKDAEAEDYSRKGRDIRDKYLAGIVTQVDQLSAQQKALESGGSSVNVTYTVNEQNPRAINPKSGAEFTVGAAQTPKAPGLKAHNVRVVLESSSTKRDQIQAAIDKGKLARVLQ